MKARSKEERRNLEPRVSACDYIKVVYARLVNWAVQYSVFFWPMCASVRGKLIVLNNHTRKGRKERQY